MIAVVGCENFQTQALLRSRNIEEDGGAREKKNPRRFVDAARRLWSTDYSLKKEKKDERV